MTALPDPALRCLGSRRHLLEEGITYEELVHGQRVWVARLVCVRCGSVRITFYEPHPGWVALSAHRYFRPREYVDLMGSHDATSAFALMMNALWTGPPAAGPA